MTGDGPCACLWHFVYVNVCVICVQVYVCSRLYTCARVGTYIRISVLNVPVHHTSTAKLICPDDTRARNGAICIYPITCTRIFPCLLYIWYTYFSCACFLQMQLRLLYIYLSQICVFVYMYRNIHFLSRQARTGEPAMSVA